MKLSEYIKRLQKIAREQKRKDQDPDVCMSRYSDLTTDLGEERGDNSFPRVIRAMTVTGAEWIMRDHERMSDAQKALVTDYVELGYGN